MNNICCVSITTSQVDFSEIEIVHMNKIILGGGLIIWVLGQVGLLYRSGWLIIWVLGQVGLLYGC